jgi:hypothetical protein
MRPVSTLNVSPRRPEAVALFVIFSTRLSLVLFVLILFLYMIPGQIDRHWLRSAGKDPRSGMNTKPHCGTRIQSR